MTVKTTNDRRMSWTAPNPYHCIGNDLHGYFVETTYPSSMMWIVPGTYPDDPSRVVEA
jgi:hypothetical protein